MSDHAFDFLQSWVVENVKTTMYEEKETAQHLAHDCIWEAKTMGIAKADLIEAAGGDLNAYISARYQRAAHPGRGPGAGTRDRAESRRAAAKS